MRFLLPLMLLACASDDASTGDTSADTAATSCEYPSYAEPMAVGQAIAPYRWAQALLADGRTLPLDLAAAHCNTTADFDWSPHDYMLLVSVPAW